MVFADYVLRIFLRGKDYLSDTALMSMGADLIHIMMPFLILICIIGMFSGFLNINRSYFITAVAPNTTPIATSRIRPKTRLINTPAPERIKLNIKFVIKIL